MNEKSKRELSVKSHMAEYVRCNPVAFVQAR